MEHRTSRRSLVPIALLAVLAASSAQAKETEVLRMRAFSVNMQGGRSPRP